MRRPPAPGRRRVQRPGGPRGPGGGRGGRRAGRHPDPARFAAARPGCAGPSGPRPAVRPRPLAGGAARLQGPPRRVFAPRAGPGPGADRSRPARRLPAGADRRARRGRRLAGPVSPRPGHRAPRPGSARVAPLGRLRGRQGRLPAGAGGSPPAAPRTGRLGRGPGRRRRIEDDRLRGRRRRRGAGDRLRRRVPLRRRPVAAARRRRSPGTLPRRHADRPAGRRPAGRGGRRGHRRAAAAPSSTRRPAATSPGPTSC